VKGAINAQRVIIQEGALVESNISYDRFSIEEGAYFKGSSMPNDSTEASGSPSEAL
jgi:cytoskeletal protein CcmA (bactofilin family)